MPFHFLFLLGCAKHELKYPRPNKISILVGGVYKSSCVRYKHTLAPLGSQVDI